jgi:hypothetical protein
VVRSLVRRQSAFQSESGPDHGECGGWWVHNRARSLALSKWTAGATLILGKFPKSAASIAQ